MYKYKEKMKILIVEDDKTLNNGIAMTLGGYEIVQAYHLAEARRLLADSHPDLVLLDINLPDGSGLDFCRELKKDSEVPVIFLTANDMEIDVVAGLESGASDYITKPFSLAILRARVAAVLRDREVGNHSGDTSLRVQISGEENAGQECSIGNGRTKKNNAWQYSDSVFNFDFEAMCFTAAGDRVELSKTEQRLLRILVTNRGQTLRREYLLARIWPDGTEYVDANALSVTMRRLREKLPGIPVRTVYGIGYVWDFAFMGNDSLEKVVVPDSCKILGACAFWECSNLAEVEFGANSELLIVDDFCFSECYALQQIRLPDSVYLIGEAAFSYTQIQRFVFPEQIVFIGDQLFWGTPVTELTFHAWSLPQYIGSEYFSTGDDDAEYRITLPFDADADRYLGNAEYVMQKKNVTVLFCEDTDMPEDE